MTTASDRILSKADDLFRTDCHPRLFFSTDDLAGIRKAVKEGLRARACEELARRCAAFCEPEAWEKIIPADGNGVGSMAINDPLLAFAFAWAYTEDPTWLERATAILARVAEKGYASRWSHSSIPQEAVPVAYDILHDKLPEEMRNALHKLIRREVSEYQANYLEKPTRYVWGLGCNTSLASLQLYSYWLAAGYDPETDRQAADDFAGLMRRSLHLGIDEGGMIAEGPNYGVHDAWRWAVPAFLLRRMGIADLWTEEPRLGAMIRHWAYLILPGSHEINPVGDSVRTNGNWPLLSHLLFARIANDPVVWWIWEAMGSRSTMSTGGLVSGGGVAGGGAAPECFKAGLELTALWEDESPSCTPGDAGWPTSWSSGAFGVNVMRSSWEEDALYFSLLASGRTPGASLHRHVDAGHFSLYALGESFSIDSGYGDIAGKHHSVMIPQGKEPPSTPHHFGTAPAGGYTEAFAHGTSADYCRVNLAWQWDCYWNYRHAMLVRAPGAEPYVILLDNVNYRSSYGYYDWLLNTEPGNRIVPDPEQAAATIFGKQNRLQLAWVMPSATEYPEPHRLEFETDEMDSTPLDHISVGLRLGTRHRPRLKATLWAHNGLLMTVLIPRREGQTDCRIERLKGPLQYGFRIHHDNVTDTVIANPLDRAQSVDGVRGEATLAIARRNQDGVLKWAAAADAFSLSVDDTPVLAQHGQPVELAEYNESSV